MCSAQLASQTPLAYEAWERYEVVLLAVGDGARSGDGIERRSRETVLIIDVLDQPDAVLTSMRREGGSTALASTMGGETIVFEGANPPAPAGAEAELLRGAAAATAARTGPHRFHHPSKCSL